MQPGKVLCGRACCADRSNARLFDVQINAAATTIPSGTVVASFVDPVSIDSPEPGATILDDDGTRYHETHGVEAPDNGNTFYLDKGVRAGMAVDSNGAPARVQHAPWWCVRAIAARRCACSLPPSVDTHAHHTSHAATRQTQIEPLSCVRLLLRCAGMQIIHLKQTPSSPRHTARANLHRSALSPARLSIRAIPSPCGNVDLAIGCPLLLCPVCSFEAIPTSLHHFFLGGGGGGIMFLFL